MYSSFRKKVRHFEMQHLLWQWNSPQRNLENVCQLSTHTTYQSLHNKRPYKRPKGFLQHLHSPSALIIILECSGPRTAPYILTGRRQDDDTVLKITVRRKNDHRNIWFFFVWVKITLFFRVPSDERLCSGPLSKISSCTAVVCTQYFYPSVALALANWPADSSNEFEPWLGMSRQPLKHVSQRAFCYQPVSTLGKMWWGRKGHRCLHIVDECA